MYTEWMRTEIDDTLESISDRAMVRAREKWIAQQFQFSGVVYRTDPARADLQTIQVLGDVRQDVMRSEAEAEIMRCSASLGVDWTIENIFLDCLTRVGGYLLVAGENTRWLEDVRIRLCDRLIADNPKHIQSITGRRVVVAEGPTVVFETYTDPSVFRGMTFEVAYLQEQEKEIMGGNYNEFPWVDKGRSSWDAKNEAKRQKDIASAKAEKELLLAPAPIFSAADLEKLQKSYYEPTFSTGVQTPGMIYWYGAGPEWNSYPTYGGISRGPQTAEDRLAVVRDVLLEHLRFQMQQAPSSGAVYANDVKTITAADIARVVQALEGDPAPQFMPKPWGMQVGVDFAAESPDGSKIVIEKRFQSGVIFDPANRPIRKFRMKEESAA